MSATDENAAKKIKPARKRFIAPKKPAALGKTYMAYLYLLPVFFFLGLFTYYAMIYNMQVSLYKWDGVSSKKVFVGLQNFINLLKDPYFVLSLKNTGIFFLITIPVQAVLGFILANLLRKKLFIGSVARTIVFLPNIMALVVIGYVFSQMYNYQVGFLNEIFRGAGLDSLAKDWTGDPRYSLYAVIVANIYTYVGFSMTLYIAGLLGIGRDVSEAAVIDGATGWKTIRYIDLPLLLSTHVTIVILGVVGTLKTFDIVWLITKGGPARKSDMLATFLYRSYILEYKAGYAAAIAVVVLLIALAMSIVNLHIQRRNAI